jgi:large subunit ribosomal protein L31
MKSAIHPKYYPDCQVTCTCGNSFQTGSTLPEIKVEICSACHPFFTGQLKYVDTKGRIDRFLEKVAKGKKYQKKTKKKSSPKKKK